MSKKSTVIAGSVLVLSLFVTTGALAASTKSTQMAFKTNLKAGMYPSAKGKAMMTSNQNMSFGTINAINGSSFTITSKKMAKIVGTATTTTTPITITVNTSATTIFKKDGTVATLGDLTVGQMVIVKGLKDANNVIANAISVNINTHPITWSKGTKGAKPGTQPKQ